LSVPASAQLALDRAAAEVELLASVADSPRQSWPILAGCGITADSFAEHDTRAIFRAIEPAADPHGPAQTKLDVLLWARRLLRAEGLWDGTDERPFVSGSRWGPRAVAAVLCRVPFDTNLIRATAARLLAVDAKQRAMKGGRRCA
jgi:hypothetical protein